MPRIEVYPSDDGWHVSDQSDVYENRRHAIDAAYEVRSACADGEKPAIVLMRPDGSVYGEMMHGEANSNAGRQVGIEPASENGEAA